MTPRAGNVNQYPIIVASKIRALFEYQRLPLVMRERIRVRRHPKGLSLAPVDAEDVEALAWIKAQADRWGVMRWRVGPATEAGGGGGKVGGWAKEKSKKDSR